MSNSLAAVHPELIVEWSDRNLPLTPDSVTFGSNKKVWWKGACGHEWETSVKARSNGEKCPICSGARVVTGITGFDSKWINTLYLDKVLQYENIIQAFSRTNRLFGPDKPFGTIRYYRKPHTMERNINAAVKLYSGDKPLGLFVQHLVENLKRMNELFGNIFDLFHNAGIENFEKLPTDTTICRKFAKDFNEFNEYLEAAKIQGFKWGISSYVDETTGEVVDVTIDENTYLILALRYKELSSGSVGTDGGDDVPYDLVGYITEIDTGLIDSDYMNSRFDKYIKLINADGTTQEAIEQAETELHKTFATLSQEEQKYANIFLHDIQRGDVVVTEGKSLRDYINEYLSKAKNDQIHQIATALRRLSISINLSCTNYCQDWSLTKNLIGIGLFY